MKFTRKIILVLSLSILCSCSRVQRHCLLEVNGVEISTLEYLEKDLTSYIYVYQGNYELNGEIPHSYIKFRHDWRDGWEGFVSVFDSKLYFNHNIHNLSVINQNDSI